MSARKSFDLEPRRPSAKKKQAPKRTKREEPAPRRRKSLRSRREEQQATLRFIVLGVVLVGVGLAVYGLWRPEVRIQSVEAKGVSDKEGVAAVAQEELSGTYYHVLPRDSFFFYPERSVEAKVLAAYPSIAKVRVSRAGLTSLSLEATARMSAFVWCGSPDSAPFGTNCYDADAQGLVFEQSEATTSEALRVYADLDGDGSPLRSRVKGAEHLGDVLRFVTKVRALQLPVVALGFRGDEADLYVGQGTRLTYVLGKERDAYESATAALPKLNLLDGSIEYVDLRFPGKVYVKRVGE